MLTSIFYSHPFRIRVLITSTILGQHGTQAVGPIIIAIYGSSFFSQRSYPVAPLCLFSSLSYPRYAHKWKWIWASRTGERARGEHRGWQRVPPSVVEKHRRGAMAGDRRESHGGSDGRRSSRLNNSFFSSSSHSRCLGLPQRKTKQWIGLDFFFPVKLLAGYSIPEERVWANPSFQTLESVSFPPFLAREPEIFFPSVCKPALDLGWRFVARTRLLRAGRRIILFPHLFAPFSAVRFGLFAWMGSAVGPAAPRPASDGTDTNELRHRNFCGCRQ